MKILDEKTIEGLNVNPDFVSVMTLIGFENMVKLSRACGGKQIYIPHASAAQRMRKNNLMLDRIIGKEAADALGHIYGGIRYEISPDLCRKILILDEVAAGKSQMSIAHQFLLHRRTVGRFIECVRKTGGIKIGGQNVKLPPQFLKKIKPASAAGAVLKSAAPKKGTQKAGRAKSGVAAHA